MGDGEMKRSNPIRKGNKQKPRAENKRKVFDFDCGRGWGLGGKFNKRSCVCVFIYVCVKERERIKRGWVGLGTKSHGKFVIGCQWKRIVFFFLGGLDGYVTIERMSCLMIAELRKLKTNAEEKEQSE